MKKVLFLLVVATPLSLMATSELNSSTEQNQSKTIQETSKEDQAQRVAKALEEQMKKEEKYAKEQRFYQGEEYNLSAVEIDQGAVDAVPLIEPDYDFEIDDVYRDDI